MSKKPSRHLLPWPLACDCQHGGGRHRGLEGVLWKISGAPAHGWSNAGSESMLFRFCRCHLQDWWDIRSFEEADVGIALRNGGGDFPHSWDWRDPGVDTQGLHLLRWVHGKGNVREDMEGDAPQGRDVVEAANGWNREGCREHSFVSAIDFSVDSDAGIWDWPVQPWCASEAAGLHRDLQEGDPTCPQDPAGQIQQTVVQQSDHSSRENHIAADRLWAQALDIHHCWCHSWWLEHVRHDCGYDFFLRSPLEVDEEGGAETCQIRSADYDPSWTIDYDFPRALRFRAVFQACWESQEVPCWAFSQCCNARPSGGCQDDQGAGAQGLCFELRLDCRWDLASSIWQLVSIQSYITSLWANTVSLSH